MRRETGAIAFLAALVAVALVAISASGSGPADPRAEATKKPIKYSSDDLFIETNATDGDAGLQSDLDGEDWRTLKIKDPDGNVIVDVRNKGRLRNYGLTGLTFESAEPGFDEHSFATFKRKFPEGTYRIRGETIEGRKLVGSDRLTHVIPKIPKVTSPAEKATVPAAGFEISWEPVTKPSGVKIVRHIVIVTQEGGGGDRELSIDLPGDVTSATVPPGFLEPGKAKFEVIAREKSGNQTIAELQIKAS